jgi:hypothetical protein
MALASAQKGTCTIAEFFSKIKSLADDMASAGKKLEDEEIASYILAGLDMEYNGIQSRCVLHFSARGTADPRRAIHPACELGTMDQSAERRRHLRIVG